MRTKNGRRILAIGKFARIRLAMRSKFTAILKMQTASNQRLKFAAKIGANAVHIGKDDGGVKAARKILGEDAFIGVSCYDDLNLALKAQDDGASYAAFGALFASPTKPHAPLCKFETIMRAKEILRIPVCAIGGINAANIAQIAALNPDYIAVISALYRPASIKENLRNLQAFL